MVEKSQKLPAAENNLEKSCSPSLRTKIDMEYNFHSEKKTLTKFWNLLKSWKTLPFPLVLTGFLITLISFFENLKHKKKCLFLHSDGSSINVDLKHYILTMVP